MAGGLEPSYPSNLQPSIEGFGLVTFIRSPLPIASLEEFLRNAFEYAVIGISLLSPSGRFLRANKALCEMVGYTEEELLERSFQDITHTADLERNLLLFHQFWSNEFNSCEFEKRYVCKDGQSIHIRMNVAAIRDENGWPKYFIAQAQNITGLKQHQEFLRQIIDINPHFVFAKDRTGRFTMVNKSVADAYGTTVEVLIGKRDRDFNNVDAEVEGFLHDDLEVMNSLQEKIIPEEQITDFQGRTRYLQTVKRPLIDEDGIARQVLGVATDITERKLAEQERERLEVQVRQSQKLESLGVLAGGVAHDFNNFLMGILGHISLALQDLDPESKEAKSIIQAKNAALRASDLTNQLLAYSGRGTRETQVLNLQSLLSDLTDLLRTAISKKAKLKLDFSRDFAPIRGDAAQLRQVFMNLLTNASDALEDRPGEISITLDRIVFRTEQQFPLSGGTVLPAGEYVRVSVQDSGCGMDDDTLHRIFDPFFTTKFTGRGLGLAAVLGIVKGHQGALTVESKRAVGTTFNIFLPICQEGERPAPTASEPTRPLNSATGAILVVDDDDSIREVSREILRRFGYSVVEASNGMEALTVLQEHPEDIRAVLLDLTMPEMSGVETLHEIRRMLPTLPVLISSGYSAQENSDVLQQYGNCGFIQKPYEARMLLERLASMIPEEPVS